MNVATRLSIRVLERFMNPGKLSWYRAAAFLVSVGVVVFTGYEVLPGWQKPGRGWEGLWIAKSLAAGKGFSFPSEKRWLFDAVHDGGFHPTAWADPIYTFCLAGMIRLFGEYHQLAALIFNLVLLLAVFGLTYRLGERLISAPAGLIAVLGLSLISDFRLLAGIINNGMMAPSFVALSALMMVNFLEEPTNRRSGALGLVLGSTALACPSAQLFIPVTAIAVAVWGWRKLGPTVPQAILVFVVAVLTMLPWTARNYLVFGKLIPVRTGSGQITFESVVATAGTVAPDKLRSHVKPPWNAGTPREAVVRTVGTDRANIYRRRALERFQVEYAKDIIPAAELATMDESQRDAWFLSESKAFLVANPVLSAQLAIAKIEVFIRTGRAFYGLGALLAGGVCLLAALGGLLAIRNPAVLTLAVWVGAYVGPFLLITPYFYRYRAPIEPLLVVLAAYTVCRMLKMGSHRLQQLQRPNAGRGLEGLV
jgi:4-amino-4-deoxy-L-arabinose transferase-like glycosyltransferase